ncbi:MAG: hypothetical protein R3Y53_04525 [Bacillota bacterium]
MKYMKKISLSLALILMLGTAGCGTSSEDVAENSQEVTEEISEEDILKILEELSGVNMLEGEIALPEIGVTFTMPEEFILAENVNLLPEYEITIDNPIYAYLQYYYAPDENMTDIEEINLEETTMYQYAAPAFMFFVVKEENLEEPIVVNSMKLYDTVEELSIESGYHIYFMTDYNDTVLPFEEEAQAKYEEVVAITHKILDNVETSVPDEMGVRRQIEQSRQGLEFVTETLDGEPIDSSIFSEYTLTMINFWGSYVYPQIDELEDLEHMYYELSIRYPDVNFFQVIIDTPNEEVEELVLSLYEENDINFKGVKTDLSMVEWIERNLTGLPTTIFVDSTGYIYSTTIEGIQDTDYYMEAMVEILNEIGV